MMYETIQATTEENIDYPMMINWRSIFQTGSFYIYHHISSISRYCLFTPNRSNLANMAESSRKIPFFATPSDPSVVIPVDAFPPESYFEQQITYPALIIPAKLTATLRKSLKDVLLQRPKIKAVYPFEDDPLLRKLVLTNTIPNIYETHAAVAHAIITLKCQKSQFNLTLSYSDWTVEQVLRDLLPVKEIPSAFEIVGHVAHVNLRDEVLPFQNIVGKVLLDKNAPRIATVVTKVGTIHTEYRTFDMKVIAGGNENGKWNIVTVKEEKCIFQLDFLHVYWNSRLAGEHKRMVQYILQKSSTTPGAVVVADAMAGVGPFAIPLTTCENNKKQSSITVHANDLNPTSFHYLEINAKKNKCHGIFCYSMDGRAFLHQLDNTDNGVDFVLMNLPASAPEFLDAFRGWKSTKLPEIMVYCFDSKTLEIAKHNAIDRCVKALGCDISNAQVHVVRDVSPKKNMYCVSFALPEAARSLERITIRERVGNEIAVAEPCSKKAKVS